ncbi:PAS domain-containing protein, partial [Nocardiopsis alba]|uniref:PAS domain-containing protein n=1 Tax=Nocardiopsis alba TaxID=53437 RepID=UPI003404E82E
MRTLLTDAPIGFALLGPDDAFGSINPRMASVFGSTPERCLGRTPGQVLEEAGDTAGASAQVACLTGAREGGRAVRGRHRTPDGRVWDLTWFPVEDPTDGGEHIALIAGGPGPAPRRLGGVRVRRRRVRRPGRRH